MVARGVAVVVEELVKEGGGPFDQHEVVIIMNAS